MQNASLRSWWPGFFFRGYALKRDLSHDFPPSWSWTAQADISNSYVAAYREEINTRKRKRKRERDAVISSLVSALTKKTVVPRGPFAPAASHRPESRESPASSSTIGNR